MFADKLMEETEELCLQREQKEVSAHHKSISFNFYVQDWEAGSCWLEGISGFRDGGFGARKCHQPTSGSCG